MFCAEEVGHAKTPSGEIRRLLQGQHWSSGPKRPRARAQAQTVADRLNGGDWKLVGEFTEVESASRKANKAKPRPQLEAALAHCRIMGARLICKRQQAPRDPEFMSNSSRLASRSSSATTARRGSGRDLHAAADVQRRRVGSGHDQRAHEESPRRSEGTGPAARGRSRQHSRDQRLGRLASAKCARSGRGNARPTSCRSSLTCARRRDFASTDRGRTKRAWGSGASRWSLGTGAGPSRRGSVRSMSETEEATRSAAPCYHGCTKHQEKRPWLRSTCTHWLAAAAPHRRSGRPARLRAHVKRRHERPDRDRAAPRGHRSPATTSGSIASLTACASSRRHAEVLAHPRLGSDRGHDCARPWARAMRGRLSTGSSGSPSSG